MAVTPDQLVEIEAARSQRAETRRSTVAALEEMLFCPLPVLDHGFVRVIDYMGCDAAIVQAARISHGRGTKKVNEDANLIRHLMRSRHSTPFEMCEIKLHIKLPIFVARQWIRHRTANVNEYSARYSILDREFYVPPPEHIGSQSKTNRQGRGDVVTAEEAAMVINTLRDDAIRCYQHYAEMLNEDEARRPLDPTRRGVARELARMNLTLNTYTQLYWKIDLHNLLHFVSVRATQHAQYEIRAYAQVIMDIVRMWVPVAYRAFLDYQHGAFTLSSQMLSVVRRMVTGGHVEQSDSGLSKREWTELKTALGLP